MADTKDRVPMGRLLEDPAPDGRATVALTPEGLARALLRGGERRAMSNPPAPGSRFELLVRPPTRQPRSWTMLTEAIRHLREECDRRADVDVMMLRSLGVSYHRMSVHFFGAGARLLVDGAPVSEHAIAFGPNARVDIETDEPQPVTISSTWAPTRPIAVDLDPDDL